MTVQPKRSGTVSVIIPTYNRAELLPEALQSVFAQTYDHLEVIVVDDGSEDDTPSKLRAIDDPRLTVIEQTNQGKSSARNRGLEAAAGEFIAFLDSDDVWPPNSVARRMEAFENEPQLDFVFGDFVRFDADEGDYEATQFDIVPEVRRLRTRPTASGVGRVIVGEPFPSLVRIGVFVTWLPTVLIRRDSLGTARFPPGVPLGQDHAFMLRVYAASSHAGFLDEPLARVRRHEGNSYSAGNEQLYPTLRLFEAAMNDTACEEWKDVIAWRIGKEWSNIGYHHFWAGEPLSAARAYLSALARPGTTATALKHLVGLPISFGIAVKRHMGSSRPTES